jgi:hypothetical protein
VWSLLGLAHVAGALGRTVDEERWAHEALEIVDEMGDRWGKANCLAVLAHIASVRGEWDRAVSLAQESLSIRREIATPWGVVMSLNLLGTIAADRGDGQGGRSFFQDALPRAVSLGANALALESLAGIARTSADPLRARDLFAYCLQNPAASAETRTHVVRWLSKLQKAGGIGRSRKVSPNLARSSIEEVARQVLAEPGSG